MGAVGNKLLRDEGKFKLIYEHISLVPLVGLHADNKNYILIAFTHPIKWLWKERNQGEIHTCLNLSHDTTKCVFESFRPRQTQTSLCSHRS